MNMNNLKTTKKYGS